MYCTYFIHNFYIILKRDAWALCGNSGWLSRNSEPRVTQPDIQFTYLPIYLFTFIPNLVLFVPSHVSPISFRNRHSAFCNSCVPVCLCAFCLCAFLIIPWLSSSFSYICSSKQIEWCPIFIAQAYSHSSLTLCVPTAGKIRIRTGPKSYPKCYKQEMKYTQCFLYTRSRTDRVIIKDEWIQRAINEPVRMEIQSDKRIRKWVKIQEENKYLRVILLPDGETVHNAFFGQDYKEE